MAKGKGKGRQGGRKGPRRITIKRYAVTGHSRNFNPSRMPTRDAIGRFKGSRRKAGKAGARVRKQLALL